MTDIEIIKAFRTSNQRVIHQSYYAMREKFFSYISRVCSSIDNSSIEDIYHTSLIELQQNILNERLTEGNLKCSLQTYLNSIGYNVAMSNIRKQHIVYVNNPEHSQRGIYNPMPLIIEHENFKIIHKVISEMGKPCAPILVAYYWNNLKMERIAKKLGYKNADSVKAQKNRCMNKLKEYITKLIPDNYNDN